MNKQRKVLVTTTYNELGIIIDTKVEEVVQPNLQPSAEPQIIRCKDCKHFHYDIPYLIQGIPVLMHEICTFWGNGCKTSENEFCSHAERRKE